MWSDTVTRYRLVDGQVEAKTYSGVHYEHQMESRDSVRGGAAEGLGRLFILGDADIRVGDKVAPGQALQLPWGQLLPGLTPGLTVIDYVKPWYLSGNVHHTEAGRGKGPEGR